MKAQPSKHRKQALPRDSSIIEFEDNRRAQILYGEHDRHLALLETQLGVELLPRGNHLNVLGNTVRRKRAETVLRALYAQVARGRLIDDAAIATAVRMADGESAPDSKALRTPRRLIEPRSLMQARYLEAIQKNDLTFGVGPAGTGKTYLAVAMGVMLLMQGEVDRLVLSRPAVEAGERLGFLPGDLREKVDPYLRPLYDALNDMLPSETVQRKIEQEVIEIAPLAFMRGRTLANAFVILDEAQNATPVQMKMFLTRLGEHARMVVTGDPSQVDLPHGQPSGLDDACQLLRAVEGVSIVRFTQHDVVRHALVTRIVNAYNDRDRARAKPARARKDPSASMPLEDESGA